MNQAMIYHGGGIHRGSGVGFGGGAATSIYVNSGADETESSTTSSTFVNKLTVNFTATSGVRYMIEGYCEMWAPSDEDVETEMVVDSTQRCFGYHKSHSYGDTWSKWNGGFYFDSTLSGSIDVEINYRNSYGANSKKVRRARIMITKLD